MFPTKSVFYKNAIFHTIMLLYIFSFACRSSEIFPSNHSSLSLLYGEGSKAKIQNIIGRKKLISPVSYLTGVEYRSPYIYQLPIKLDTQILKHFGRQHAFEVVVCPVIETSNVFLGKIGFTWAIGNGVSGLIGKYTNFEETKGVKTRRFLNYLLIEQNTFLKEYANYQLTLRWHHRCHVFGKIAPKGTGSNFFIIGIKYVM